MMCERTCPECGSSSHFEHYGVSGTSITCDGCGLVLAARVDPDAHLISATEDEVEDWISRGTWVRPGAEAKDPKDDVLYTYVRGQHQ